MFKTDILFTGFYGHKNTGDDAFVEVAAWGARNVWNKDKVRFLAKNNCLPHTVIPTRAFPFGIPKTYSLQLKTLLRNTDYLISAGGSTIHSKMRESNPKAMAIKLKANGKKIKIGGIGVSVGPFNSIADENAVVEYLRCIDFLALRDQASYDYVSSLDALPYKPVNAFDLAALLPEVYSFTKKDRLASVKKIVGISVCPYESLQKHKDSRFEENRNKKFIDLIKALDKEGNIHFRFYIINGNNRIGDHKLTQQTILQAAPTSYEVVEYNKNTRYTWESIAECDFVIATRLHAAIFACFSNTPFMLNEYHPKCSHFLENIGYQENYRMYNSEYDVNEKAVSILEIINNPANYITPYRIKEMSKLAAFNFTAISL